MTDEEYIKENWEHLTPEGREFAEALGIKGGDINETRVCGAISK